MRKTITITNYHPSKLREARELSGMSLEEVEAEGYLEAEQLSEYETREPPIPFDIFILGSLLNRYEDKAKEYGKEKLGISLTSDILFPHPEGLKYQERIAGHPNYEGMPDIWKKDGGIKWLATKKSRLGQKRLAFWDGKMKELRIKGNILDHGNRQKTAFKNHPDKLHVCLYTGQTLFLDYRYPAPNRIDHINREYDEEFKYYDLDILELAAILYEEDGCKTFADIFNVKQSYTSLQELKSILQSAYIDTSKINYVSPGAMSNSPDRLDGFHSYNSDVRDVCDKGRRKKNLQRYTQDRRVYEKWAGGNWKLADRLYAEFKKHGVSPDHIGPLSLGFTHRPKFQAMTSRENSAKGNRMTLGDVKSLIEDELNGDLVVTWHSKYIWDKLKHRVSSNEDARRLSAVMRKNHHHFLIFLSLINANGFSTFLKGYINPEFSYFDYRFEGLNPETGEFTKATVKELNGQCQRNNAERYERIAFEKLEEYSLPKNRKDKIWKSKAVDREVDRTMEILRSGSDREGREQVSKVLTMLAEEAAGTW